MSYHNAGNTPIRGSFSPAQSGAASTNSDPVIVIGRQPG